MYSILFDIYESSRSSAFYGAEIKEIHLHHDIILIDEGAFAYSNIKIDLRELTNLKTIGDGAFYKSIEITIYLPQTLETIGSYAFANNPLSIISIPNIVISIGKSCFKML